MYIYIYIFLAAYSNYIFEFCVCLVCIFIKKLFLLHWFVCTWLFCFYVAYFFPFDFFKTKIIFTVCDQKQQIFFSFCLIEVSIFILSYIYFFEPWKIFWKTTHTQKKKTKIKTFFRKRAKPKKKKTNCCFFFTSDSCVCTRQNVRSVQWNLLLKEKLRIFFWNLIH